LNPHPAKTRYFCTPIAVSHIVAERTGTGTHPAAEWDALDHANQKSGPKTPYLAVPDAASWFDPKDQLPEWPARFGGRRA